MLDWSVRHLGTCTHLEAVSTKPRPPFHPRAKVHLNGRFREWTIPGRRRRRMSVCRRVGGRNVLVGLLRQSVTVVLALRGYQRPERPGPGPDDPWTALTDRLSRFETEVLTATWKVLDSMWVDGSRRRRSHRVGEQVVYNGHFGSTLFVFNQFGDHRSAGERPVG